MAPKAASKQKCTISFDGGAVAWSDRVVCEAVKFDAYEDRIAQIIAEYSQFIEDRVGEAGIDYSIHEIDMKMGKKLWRTEIKTD